MQGRVVIWVLALARCGIGATSELAWAGAWTDRIGLARRGRSWSDPEIVPAFLTPELIPVVCVRFCASELGLDATIIFFPRWVPLRQHS